MNESIYRSLGQGDAACEAHVESNGDHHTTEILDHHGSLARRMYDAGYELTWSGRINSLIWTKRISAITRVARKDHKDGRIKAGMKYREYRSRDVCAIDGGKGVNAGHSYIVVECHPWK